VAVQEIRWAEGGIQQAETHTFLHGNGNSNHYLETGFFMCKGIISAVKRIEFINDSISYITLGGRWCDIIVLNVHAPIEDKTDQTKDSFAKTGKCILTIPNVPHETYVTRFHCKSMDRRYFKTIRNESLHEISNDNGITTANTATSRDLFVKSTMLPHCNIHKYT
jgi:hypothetical protein